MSLYKRIKKGSKYVYRTTKKAYKKAKRSYEKEKPARNKVIKEISRRNNNLKKFLYGGLYIR